MLSVVLGSVIALQSKSYDYVIIRIHEKPPESQGGLRQTETEPFEPIQIGTAKIQSKVADNGGKRVDTKASMTENGRTVTMLQSASWNAKAAPTQKSLQIFDDKGEVLYNVTVQFVGMTAITTNKTVGKIATGRVKAPGNAKVADLAEFWWLRDQPVPQQKETVWRFDLNTLKWENTVVTYLGKESKKVGEKTLTVHHSKAVSDKRTTDWWDDEEGFLVMAEASDGIRFQRLELK